MSDQELNSKADLIANYLSGNASDAEVQTLETWVLASPKHKKEFVAAKKAWMLSGMTQNSTRIDVAKNWKDTAAQLFEDKPVIDMQRRGKRLRWMGIAAAIAVVLSIAVWLLLDLGKERVLEFAAASTVRTLDLPDGSQITLNQAASLTYDGTSAAGNRIVTLEGDAFFEVSRDELRPFIINTKGLAIEVLGTSFYVDAREEEPEIQVIVESGVVEVRSDSIPLRLAANEKAVFEKATKNLTKDENTDANYLSIKTNALDFEDSSLEEVIFALNRHFNVQINLSIEDLENCRVTATYEDKSLAAILTIIETTLGIQSVREGANITLSGASCR